MAVMGRGSKGSEMCASSGLVAAAEAFVRAELAGADGSHDFAHVERVRASAARLAADEGLGAADVAVAEVAALLHDVKGASQCRLPRSCLCSLERACEHPGTCIHPDRSGPLNVPCAARVHVHTLCAHADYKYCGDPDAGVAASRAFLEDNGADAAFIDAVCHVIKHVGFKVGPCAASRMRAPADR